MKNIIDDLLVRQHLTSLQVEQARQYKSQNNKNLIDLLLDLEFVTEDALLDSTMRFFSYPEVRIAEKDVDYQTLRIFPVDFIKRHGVLPLTSDDRGRLEIAISNPYDMEIMDQIRAIVPGRFQFVLARRSEIMKKIGQCLNQEQLNSAVDKVTEFSTYNLNVAEDELTEKSAILNADQSPIVALVNTLICSAVQEKASDIHIEPKEHHLELRYRVNGVLQLRRKLPKNVHPHVISRLKILSDLDISESRRPQDGKIQFKAGTKVVDLRLSFMNTIFGEKVVLRILDAGELKADLGHMGLRIHQMNLLNKMIKQPQGMLIACGPTGAGKTTTLYALLNRVKSIEKNIMTVEDPVEYTIDGVVQTQVNEKIGITFASGMRTILRQDPDCILVGEIRDAETADMAFRASLTGHLVLTTLHTNCSASSVTRLRNIGIEPFLIASSVLGVIAQRLVRTNCPKCLGEYEPPVFFLDMFQPLLQGRGPIRFMKGHGCPECQHTGFQDRIAIFEILPFNAEIRRLVNSEADEDAIRDCGRQYGFRSLIEEGIDRVIEGITTLEELAGVIGSRHEIGRVIADKKTILRMGCHPEPEGVDLVDDIPDAVPSFLTELF